MNSHGRIPAVSAGRPRPACAVGSQVIPAKLSDVRYIDWFGDGSLAVLDLALACCAIETEAATPASPRIWDAPPPEAKLVITVSGTLTNALAPAVRDAITAHPDATVVAFGACACVGGPYWDSYSVTKGVDQLVTVHHYIAGCPPPPEAIETLMRQVRDA